MDIEMFGQLLPEQASAPDSATTYGFAGPVTGTLPPLLSHQLIPNLGHAIKGPIFRNAVSPLTCGGHPHLRARTPSEGFSQKPLVFRVDGFPRSGSRISGHSSFPDCHLRNQSTEKR